jgi:hypothetical protein
MTQISPIVQIALSQAKAWIKGQPRAMKIAVVQQFVFPECDLEDLGALRVAIEAEINHRRQEHTRLTNRILQGMK